MASETEGLPCALMEAMSCELLCISSLVGNIGDILKDGITGFTFSSGDVSKLKELMIMALENYDGFIEIRENARKLIVNEYSYEITTDKWNKIISGILQGNEQKKNI
jgi:glycosyltransferase involved in cell wall biosynthesis